MVVIGTDLHKRTHTVVAVDSNGRKLAEKTVATTADGHLELVRWARRWRERTWALEDCRHLTRRLEADLLRAGEHVLRVPPKLMAGARQSAREPGKSDPIDALSVARAALREPNLPAARLEGAERELRLLVDHRVDLITDRTGHQARLRWFLVELGISEPPPRTLGRVAVLVGLEAELSNRPELSARIGRDLIVRIRELTIAIDALEREIQARIAVLAPSLLGLVGCGQLSAAKLVGETGGIDRFRSRAAFAAHNGTAPVPGLVGQHRPPPTQPRRQSPAQPGAPSDRDHPASDRRARTRLRRPSDGRRRHEDRSDPSIAPSDQRRGLPADDARPRGPGHWRRGAQGRCLT